VRAAAPPVLLLHRLVFTYLLVLQAESNHSSAFDENIQPIMPSFPE
jgi:hypothetical protein